MKKLDSSIKAEKCNVDSTVSESNNCKNSYLLLMILLFLILYDMKFNYWV